ncbi:hypothetical protein [Bosea massiliensis]|jgi:hypothetical protein|uniref:Uncharacterized protein n=1 Tax=Bosea massiliensis TaxID=151419 RepID=A0ABW0NZV8_9HYPH
MDGPYFYEQSERPLMLYQGTGSNHSPHVPCTELVLSKALSKRGFHGRRYSCEWATTVLEQAQGYTGGSRGFLSVISPLPSAYVTWAAGVADMILDFEAWLRQAYVWEDDRIRGQSTLRDVQGSIDVFEVYASRPSGRFAIEAAHAYLADRTIHEALIDETVSLSEILDGHQGEVWITGPARKTPMPAVLAA